MPCPTGMPPRSVAPATPPSGAGSPRTIAAVVDHGPRQETQTDTRSVRVGTTQRSIAAMASAWLRRNVRQVCDGGPRRLIMYLETVDSAISKPSFSSSPWMRGAPHSGFSLLIRRMSSRSSRSIFGRPVDREISSANRRETLLDATAGSCQAGRRGPIRAGLARAKSAIPTAPGRYRAAAGVGARLSAILS